MTTAQKKDAYDRMTKNGKGLLGTREAPSRLAMFLEDFLEIVKEELAEVNTEEAWKAAKAKKDAIFALVDYLYGIDNAPETK